jgi:putative ABC transport system permease protein
MHLLLNISEAFRAVRANLLRTLLTVGVIAFGLTALIGVLTSIEGIRFWFSSSFVRLGTNTFRIENYKSEVRQHGGGRSSTLNRAISYHQASQFQEAFSNRAVVSAVGTGSITAQAKYQGASTQANILLVGSDPQYSQTDNYPLGEGRNLVEADLAGSRSVVVIGDEIRRLLFPQQDPLGKIVFVNSKPYRIVGVFEKVGSQGFLGGDKICLIPATTLQRDFPTENRSFSLHVTVPKVEQLDNLCEEATGVMRKVRRLRPTDKDDFGIIQARAMVEDFMKEMRFITWSATAIALITLFSAAIGLMNNMLVSVTERTREIGVRKALGATKSQIVGQFLTEAVVITQSGGILGILMGILIGNLVGWFLGNSFIVPWGWALGGFILCFFVGILAGIIPARRAAEVDPIESLRYE